MPRGAFVMAQALIDGQARLVRPADRRITSPGAELAVKRGELGDVRVVQFSADRRYLMIRFDFCDLQIQLTERFGRAAAAALLSSEIRLPPDEIMPLESETFQANQYGLPKVVRDIDR